MTKSDAGEGKRDGAKIKRAPIGKEGDAAYGRREGARPRSVCTACDTCVHASNPRAAETI